MFVLAADDVSKEDIEKISKKIEKQLAKWEKKDREDTGKRKRNVDTDSVDSNLRKRKKLKTEKRVVSDGGGETEIQVLQDNNACTDCHILESEEAVKKPSSFVKEKNDASYNVLEKADYQEEKQLHKSSDDDYSSDFEVIIDVDENGACKFAKVTDSENPDLESSLNQQDDIVGESENAEQIKDNPDLDSIYMEKINYLDKTRDLACSEHRNVKKCEFIVDVNEKGECNFKVVKQKLSSKLTTDNDDSFRTSKCNTTKFNYCKCGKAVYSKQFSMCVVCTKCMNNRVNQGCSASETNKKKSVSVNKENTCTSNNSSCKKGNLNKGHSFVTSDTDCKRDLDDSNSHVIDDEVTETVAVHNNVEIDSVSKHTDNKTIRDNNTASYSCKKDGDQYEMKLVCDLEGRKIPEECDIVALDCEFVGVGPRDQSALGRCSIVDFHGNILCDIYARPEDRITNYRTRWSGITRRHMNRAIPLECALPQIAKIIRNKVVVGHAIKNDFSVLDIPHPQSLIRDTAYYCPLRQRADPTGNNSSIALKKLALQLLGRIIQTHQHCSVEDARATMDLYKLVRDEWEHRILEGFPIQDEIVKTPSSDRKKEKQRRRRVRQQNRLRLNRSSVVLSSNIEKNNIQTSSLYKSKSDPNLLSGHQNSEDSRPNYNQEDGWNGYGWLEDGQKYLQDEYWQDVFDDDDSFNSFSDTYE